MCHAFSFLLQLCTNKPTNISCLNTDFEEYNKSNYIMYMHIHFIHVLSAPFHDLSQPPGDWSICPKYLDFRMS